MDLPKQHEVDMSVLERYVQLGAGSVDISVLRDAETAERFHSLTPAEQTVWVVRAALEGLARNGCIELKEFPEWYQP